MPRHDVCVLEYKDISTVELRVDLDLDERERARASVRIDFSEVHRAVLRHAVLCPCCPMPVSDHPPPSPTIHNLHSATISPSSSHPISPHQPRCSESLLLGSGGSGPVGDRQGSDAEGVGGAV